MALRKCLDLSRVHQIDQLILYEYILNWIKHILLQENGKMAQINPIYQFDTFLSNFELCSFARRDVGVIGRNKAFFLKKALNFLFTWWAILSLDEPRERKHFIWSPKSKGFWWLGEWESCWAAKMGDERYFVKILYFKLFWNGLRVKMFMELF